jgi:hypothetical protein
VRLTAYGAVKAGQPLRADARCTQRAPVVLQVQSVAVGQQSLYEPPPINMGRSMMTCCLSMCVPSLILS